MTVADLSPSLWQLNYNDVKMYSGFVDLQFLQRGAGSIQDVSWCFEAVLGPRAEAPEHVLASQGQQRRGVFGDQGSAERPAGVVERALEAPKAQKPSFAPASQAVFVQYDGGVYLMDAPQLEKQGSP